MAEATTQPAIEPTGQDLAALDLGSNSFHLIVAKQSSDRIQVIDRIKEMVRLAEGLNESGPFEEDVAARALECLERFGQRLRDIPADNVRVVGTNTFRQAGKTKGFLKRAQAALGHKIEVISGYEEARLIYLGVAHSVADEHEHRLVIDIGGGSTEVVYGRRFQTELAESLHMGCVNLSQGCFADGKLNDKNFVAAQNRARLELEPVVKQFKEQKWDTVIGASGTLLTMQGVISQLDPTATDGFTLAQVEGLIDEIKSQKQLDKLSLSGLPNERAAVFPGGVAIAHAVMTTLDIDRMTLSDGALREGLLYDLLGRVQQRDIREETVDNLIARYHIDDKHAVRVREAALGLLAQVAVAWDLRSLQDQRLLGWAATLHEIGMDISHNQYHKHGGYLLQHMDMPGFSRLDQSQLATLVRAHRRKIPKDEFSTTDGAPDEETTRLKRLGTLLRIAVVLHRNRTLAPLPHIGAKASAMVATKEKEDTLTLTMPKDWSASNPLTVLDLDQETQYLGALPVVLKIG